MQAASNIIPLSCCSFTILVFFFQASLVYGSSSLGFVMSDQQKETKAKKERKNIDAKQMLGTNVTSRFDYDQMERQR